ncbi:carbohydrate ABC transporter permease [Salipaludibacillus neizhouensis]|uniref:carbohydrate ABC transporter permease n=1 Tax=Salipaludibacillus neizhouensis TaxID=885475 RepID=UPI0028779127|nr:ABC transporter permease subunit [Salipaludibacillus neizhouensis]
MNNDLYEAADIDGANVWQKFKNVTFPAIKPVVIFLTTISIINGFRMFEESFVFWETSSPGNIGLTAVGYIYNEGILRNYYLVLVFSTILYRWIHMGGEKVNEPGIKNHG